MPLQPFAAAHELRAELDAAKAALAAATTAKTEAEAETAAVAAELELAKAQISTLRSGPVATLQDCARGRRQTADLRRPPFWATAAGAAVAHSVARRAETAQT